MTRKTIHVCDGCGKEVPEGKGATVVTKHTDARRGVKQGDLCDVCASNIPGYAVKARGRRPKVAVEAPVE